MKVVGLLSWYDEEPDWLYDAVTSAALLCDHVVALDGAYAAYPNARPRSSSGEVDAIKEAAYQAGAGFTIYQPDEPWAGNQIEKRSFLFQLGSMVTSPRDWYFVFDADDRVARVPGDAKRRLSETLYDVAVYTLGGDRYHRGLFRAFPTLRVEDAHYHYVAEKGGETIHLRGEERFHRLVEFLNLTDLRVQHRKLERSPDQLATSASYRLRVVEDNLEKTTPVEWALVRCE